MTLGYHLHPSEPQFSSSIKYYLHETIQELKKKCLSSVYATAWHIENVPKMVTIIEDRDQP